MRLGMANASVDDQIAALQRDIEEIKTAQRTSQNSGMLAYLNRAQVYNDFGDVVTWSTLSNTTPQQLAHIPLIPTPTMSHYYGITCTQDFVPAHGKPTVAIPLLELEVKTQGLTGKSSFYMVPGGHGIQMEVRNASNVVVANVRVNQAFNELFRPRYNATNQYAWQTDIYYASSVNFELSYKFMVRASDTGIATSRLVGGW